MRKPSAPKRPPEDDAEPVFFVARDLGGSVVRMLREAGLTVERFRDHFEPMAPDHDWLNECGRRGWVAVTADKRIRYDRLAQTSIVEAGTRVFVIVSNVSHPGKAESFVHAQRAVRQRLGDEPGAFIAHVYGDGSAKVMFCESDYRGAAEGPDATSASA